MSDSLIALKRGDIAAIMAAVEELNGPKRRARNEGKLIDIGVDFSPTVWEGREPPPRDENLMKLLSELSPDARDELFSTLERVAM